MDLGLRCNTYNPRSAVSVHYAGGAVDNRQLTNTKQTIQEQVLMDSLFIIYVEFQCKYSRQKMPKAF